MTRTKLAHPCLVWHRWGPWTVTLVPQLDGTPKTCEVRTCTKCGRQKIRPAL